MRRCCACRDAIECSAQVIRVVARRNQNVHQWFRLEEQGAPTCAAGVQVVTPCRLLARLSDSATNLRVGKNANAVQPVLFRFGQKTVFAMNNEFEIRGKGRRDHRQTERHRVACAIVGFGGLAPEISWNNGDVATGERMLPAIQSPRHGGVRTVMDGDKFMAHGFDCGTELLRHPCVPLHPDPADPEPVRRLIGAIQRKIRFDGILDSYNVTMVHGGLTSQLGRAANHRVRQPDHGDVPAERQIEEVFAQVEDDALAGVACLLHARKFRGVEPAEEDGHIRVHSLFKGHDSRAAGVRAQPPIDMVSAHAKLWIREIPVVAHPCNAEFHGGLQRPCIQRWSSVAVVGAGDVQNEAGRLEFLVQFSESKAGLVELCRGRQIILLVLASVNVCSDTSRVQPA